jgi:rod shape-determining protein MreB
MVVSNAIRVGGDEFDRAIQKYVLAKQGLKISEQMAEQLKMQIGNALPGKEIESVEIQGSDASQGLPRRIKIDSIEVREALEGTVQQVIDVVKTTLAQTQAGLAADIVERGIIMTGGGSLLQGLSNKISAETNVPVFVAENPLQCVALGAGKYYESAKGSEDNRSIYDRLNK